MSIFKCRDIVIRELLTIMGEKVMQSHLANTGKDGAIYENVPEELSLRGFVGIKKHKWSAKYSCFFCICSLHSDVHSFLHSSVLNHEKIKTFGVCKCILNRATLHA